MHNFEGLYKIKEFTDPPQIYKDFQWLYRELSELIRDNFETKIEMNDLSVLFTNLIILVPFVPSSKKLMSILERISKEIMEKINNKCLSDKHIRFLLQKIKTTKKTIYFYRRFQDISELVKNILEEILFKKIDSSLYNNKDLNYFILLLNVMHSFSIYEKRMLAKIESMISFLIDSDSPGIDLTAVISYFYSMNIGEGRGEFVSLKKK